jgi:hypothetical protein
MMGIPNRTRLFASLGIAAGVVLLVAASFAGEGDSKSQGKSDTKAKPAAAASTSKTLKGEIVDTGCYMGHEAHGEKHKECATKCIANGMPMALLTDAGELYLITQNHDNLDAYNQCKDMAGQIVELTGNVMSRRGMKAIQADAVKAAPAAAAK